MTQTKKNAEHGICCYAMDCEATRRWRDQLEAWERAATPPEGAPVRQLLMRARRRYAEERHGSVPSSLVPPDQGFESAALAAEGATSAYDKEVRKTEQYWSKFKRGDPADVRRTLQSDQWRTVFAMVLDREPEDFQRLLKRAQAQSRGAAKDAPSLPALSCPPVRFLSMRSASDAKNWVATVQRWLNRDLVSLCWALDSVQQERRRPASEGGYPGRAGARWRRGRVDEWQREVEAALDAWMASDDSAREPEAHPVVDPDESKAAIDVTVYVTGSPDSGRKTLAAQIRDAQPSWRTVVVSDTELSRLEREHAERHAGSSLVVAIQTTPWEPDDVERWVSDLAPSHRAMLEENLLTSWRSAPSALPEFMRRPLILKEFVNSALVGRPVDLSPRGLLRDYVDASVARLREAADERVLPDPAGFLAELGRWWIKDLSTLEAPARYRDLVVWLHHREAQLSQAVEVLDAATVIAALDGSPSCRMKLLSDLERPANTKRVVHELVRLEVLACPTLQARGSLSETDALALTPRGLELVGLALARALSRPGSTQLLPSPDEDLSLEQSLALDRAGRELLVMADVMGDAAVRRVKCASGVAPQVRLGSCLVALRVWRQLGIAQLGADLQERERDVLIEAWATAVWLALHGVGIPLGPDLMASHRVDALLPPLDLPALTRDLASVLPDLGLQPAVNLRALVPDEVAQSAAHFVDCMRDTMLISGTDCEVEPVLDDALARYLPYVVHERMWVKVDDFELIESSIFHAGLVRHRAQLGDPHSVRAICGLPSRLDECFWWRHGATGRRPDDLLSFLPAVMELELGDEDLNALITRAWQRLVSEGETDLTTLGLLSDLLDQRFGAATAVGLVALTLYPLGLGRSFGQDDPVRAEMLSLHKQTPQAAEDARTGLRKLALAAKSPADLSDSTTEIAWALLGHRQERAGLRFLVELPARLECGHLRFVAAGASQQPTRAGIRDLQRPAKAGAGRLRALFELRHRALLACARIGDFDPARHDLLTAPLHLRSVWACVSPHLQHWLVRDARCVEHGRLSVRAKPLADDAWRELKTYLNYEVTTAMRDLAAAEQAKLEPGSTSHFEWELGLGPDEVTRHVWALEVEAADKRPELRATVIARRRVRVSEKLAGLRDETLIALYHALDGLPPRGELGLICEPDELWEERLRWLLTKPDRDSVEALAAADTGASTTLGSLDWKRTSTVRKVADRLVMEDPAFRERVWRWGQGAPQLRRWLCRRVVRVVSAGHAMSDVPDDLRVEPGWEQRVGAVLGDIDAARVREGLAWQAERRQPVPRFHAVELTLPSQPEPFLRLRRYAEVVERGMKSPEWRRFGTRPQTALETSLDVVASCHNTHVVEALYGADASYLRRPCGRDEGWPDPLWPTLLRDLTNIWRNREALALEWRQLEELHAQILSAFVEASGAVDIPAAQLEEVWRAVGRVAHAAGLLPREKLAPFVQASSSSYSLGRELDLVKLYVVDLPLSEREAIFRNEEANYRTRVVAATIEVHRDQQPSDHCRWLLQHLASPHTTAQETLRELAKGVGSLAAENSSHVKTIRRWLPRHWHRAGARLVFELCMEHSALDWLRWFEMEAWPNATREEDSKRLRGALAALGEGVWALYDAPGPFAKGTRLLATCTASVLDSEF